MIIQHADTLQRIEAAPWISLNDALAVIQQIRGGDLQNAWAALSEAISAGDVGVCWLGQVGEASGAPPRDFEFLKNASIRSDHGGEVLLQIIVFDEQQAGQSTRGVGRPVYRALLVDRASLLAFFPPALGYAPPKDALLPIKRASAEKIRAAARKLYQECGGDPPNVIEAERLIRQAVPGSTRGNIRPVLKQPEFVAQRRAAGVRRPR